MSRHDRNAKLLNEHGVKGTPTFDEPIHISIQDDLANTINGQVTFLSLVNLVSRFTNVVILTAPDVPTTQWTAIGQAATLMSRAIEIRQALGADGTPMAPDLVRIHVGNTRPPGITPTIFATNDGWIATVTETDEIPAMGSANPLGALTASALGAAHAFRHLIMAKKGKPPEGQSTSRLNALNPHRADNPTWNSAKILEPVLLVGAGAVANAFLYALRTSGTQGQLLAVDGQAFKDTGANRYLLAPNNSTGSKVSLLQRAAGDGLTITSIPQDYQVWRDAVDEAVVPAVAVSTVDNRDWNRARKELQTDLPRNLIHAATGRETLSVLNVDFLNGPCLGCAVSEPAATETIGGQLAHLFGIQPQTAFDFFYGGQPLTRAIIERLAALKRKPVEAYLHFEGRPGTELWDEELCSIMNIPTPNGAIHGTCSHITLLAGVLAAVELLKLFDPALTTYRETAIVTVPAYLPVNTDRTTTKTTHRCSIDCTHPVLVDAWRKKWA